MLESAKLWELSSILMETTAFFLVTVDLYGEDRLRHLKGRMEQRFNRIRFPMRLRSVAREAGNKAVVFDTLRNGAITLVGYLFIKFLLPNHPIWELQVSLVTVLFAALFVADVVYFITTAGLYLIGKQEMKGMFLVTGACLFIASKAMTAILIFFKSGS